MSLLRLLRSGVPAWRGELKPWSAAAGRYDHYVAEFGKERSARAQAAFEANLAGIHAQNAQNDWVAGEASPSPLALGQLSWAKLSAL